MLVAICLFLPWDALSIGMNEGVKVLHIELHLFAN